jgi:hypothetical protein
MTAGWWVLAGLRVPFGLPGPGARDFGSVAGVLKSAQDAAGVLWGAQLFPGEPEVGGESTGQSELGVRGEDEQGPRFGLRGAELGRGPAEGPSKCMLDVEAQQVGAEPAFKIHLAASGPAQPQRLLRAATGLGQVLDVEADDGAAHDRQVARCLEPTRPGDLRVQSSPGPDADRPIARRTVRASPGRCARTGPIDTSRSRRQNVEAATERDRGFGAPGVNSERPTLRALIKELRALARAVIKLPLTESSCPTLNGRKLNGRNRQKLESKPYWTRSFLVARPTSNALSSWAGSEGIDGSSVHFEGNNRGHGGEA